METQIEKIIPGSQILIPIARNTNFDDGKYEPQVYGQLVLTINEAWGDGGNIGRADLTIVGAKSPRTNAFGDGTAGKFTFTNLASSDAEGTVTLNGGSLAVQLTSLGTIDYFDEDLVISQFKEGYDGSDLGELPHPYYKLMAANEKQIDLAYISGDSAPAEKVAFLYSDTPPVLLNDPAVVPECAAPLWQPERVIILQPLLLLSAEDDPNPTGGQWPALFAKAQAIWRLAGVHLAELPAIRWPTEEIANKFPAAYGLKQSPTAAAFIPYLSISSPTCVDVYLVNSPLTAGGDGGAADLPPFYLAGAKLVVCDQALGNDVLLAHELVHILKGTHFPGEADLASREWDGEAMTITEPSGDPAVSGWEQVTLPIALRANGTNGPLVFFTSNQVCLEPSP